MNSGCHSLLDIKCNPCIHQPWFSFFRNILQQITNNFVDDCSKNCYLLDNLITIGLRTLSTWFPSFSPISTANVILNFLAMFTLLVVFEVTTGARKLRLALIKSHAKYISNVAASPASRTSPLSSYRERSNKNQAYKWHLNI